MPFGRRDRERDASESDEAPEVPWPGPQFEYLVRTAHRHGRRKELEELNALGRQGWEVVGVSDEWNKLMETTDTVVYLKRPMA